MEEFRMPQSSTFDQLLEAVEHLPTDEQVALIDVVQRRLAELGRQRVADEVDEGRAANAAGRCRDASIDEIMREIES
jgi:hypothetical protein